jgi:hypothetical protein
MIWVLAWLACSALAFAMFMDSWLSDWGSINLGEVILFGMLSLIGPPSLLAASILWLASKAHRFRPFKKVIWERKR